MAGAEKTAFAAGASSATSGVCFLTVTYTGDEVAENPSPSVATAVNRYVPAANPVVNVKLNVFGWPGTGAVAVPRSVVLVKPL
jgi:hypothetical protein